jgi:hypothetical protein
LEEAVAEHAELSRNPGANRPDYPERLKRKKELEALIKSLEAANFGGAK